MSNTITFNGRYHLSNILSDKVKELFNSEDVEIIPFGFENIANGNLELQQYISTERANLSYSSMLVKFAPDYILLKKSAPQELYFLEIKVSKTPLYSSSRLSDIQRINPGKDIKISNVGDIAREAWNAYNNLFPNTIIIDACSYNNKLIMAQFINKIDCLRCYKSSTEHYDCKSCPMKSKSFFDIERNYRSAGSQTPHTNIDYSSFEEVKEFFGKLDIRVNVPLINELKETIKSEGVSFPPRTYEYVINNIKNKLKLEGCDWL